MTPSDCCVIEDVGQMEVLNFRLRLFENCLNEDVYSLLVFMVKSLFFDQYCDIFPFVFTFAW